MAKPATRTRPPTGNQQFRWRTAVLSACCKEGSVTISCGAPRRRPPQVSHGVRWDSHSRTLTAKWISPRAPRVPVQTVTHGEPPAIAGRISLIVHVNASLLTTCYSPHLCKAGVWHGVPCHPRATRGGHRRSTKVTPDHRWPQAKACSRLGGFPSFQPITGGLRGLELRDGPTDERLGGGSPGGAGFPSRHPESPRQLRRRNGVPASLASSYAGSSRWGRRWSNCPSGLLASWSLASGHFVSRGSRGASGSVRVGAAWLSSWTRSAGPVPG
jgi:hypothetical protein